MAMNHWSNGLLKTIKDTSTHIISSQQALVISDKYPKAKHHYLVLPLDDIPSIFNLTPSHIPLLEEMLLMAHNVIEVKQLKLDNFQIGFHNQPSMQRLHLHVISKDFNSPSLKTKKHWNSFNTKLFLPFEDALQQLQNTGRITRLDPVEVKALSNRELKCNQCVYIAKTMPDLKQHLAGH